MCVLLKGAIALVLIEFGVVNTTRNGYVQGIQLSQKKPHIARSTGKYRWVTPHRLVEAARATMGGIDLDPASSKKANTVVKARRIITEDEDALSSSTDWYSYAGRVWLNPPYKQPDVRQFAERLLRELRYGNVKQVIWISNDSTDTRHGQMLLEKAEVTCFTKGRIKFLDPDTLLPHNTPLQGQMIIGLGKINVRRFECNFCDFGVLVYPLWKSRWEWGRLSY